MSGTCLQTVLAEGLVLEFSRHTCFWGAARQNSYGPQGARRFNIAYHNIIFLTVLRTLRSRRLSRWKFYTHKTIIFRLLSCGVLTCHPDLHKATHAEQVGVFLLSGEHTPLICPREVNVIKSMPTNGTITTSVEIYCETITVTSR